MAVVLSFPGAGVAQSVEQRFRKPQVARSIRVAGSSFSSQSFSPQIVSHEKFERIGKGSGEIGASYWSVLLGSFFLFSGPVFSASQCKPSLLV